MEFERRRIRREFVFLNRTHQVDSPAWAIVLVAGEDIGGTSLETETAMHTGKELMSLLCQRGCKLINPGASARRVALPCLNQR
jgi:hypothetical protein